MTQGISQEKAAELLKQYGFNELPSAKPKNVWQIALEVIQEPMFILLMFCGLVYVLLGDYTEGMILLCWVFVIIFITFYQHRKTEKSLEALRQLSSPRALVIISTITFTLLLTIGNPMLQKIFSFEYPGHQHFLTSIIGAVSLLFILEVIKLLKLKLKS